MFKNSKRNLIRLEQIEIAAPCPVGWDNMAGDDRVRFCADCKLNVYNISEMSQREAEELITATEGKICVRLYQRADGTIITDNCPVGLRKLRNELRKAAAWIAACYALFIACTPLHAQAADKDKSCGAKSSGAGTTQTDVTEVRGMNGGITVRPRHFPPVEQKPVPPVSKAPNQAKKQSP